MIDNLDQQVEKMPWPEIIDGSPNSETAFNFKDRQIALTISWSWVLEKISEALIARDSKSVIKLLFSDVNYVQINRNAVEDIRSIVRQPTNENVLKRIQGKIESLKNLMSEYLEHTQNNQLQLEYMIDESNFVVEQLKTLAVVGVGAFTIASGFHLALLQEKAKLDPAKWNNVKDRAIEYSDYVAKETPQLYRLSIGLIDKFCHCTKSKSDQAESIIEYKCRYFDGKDIHLFRNVSQNAVNECNKHRLKMFYDLTDRVNRNAVTPVRSAREKWLELVASI